MKLWMSSWCHDSVVRDSTRALVRRSARTMKRVRESQRRREGKVMRETPQCNLVCRQSRVSAFSEIEQRFLSPQANRFARANREEKALARSVRNDGAFLYCPRVGMARPFAGCKNPRSARRKRSRRNDHAKLGHDISCPYTRNRILRSCRDSAGSFAARFDFGEGGGAALADGWVAGVFADVSGVVPAAVAFGAAGPENFNVKRFGMIRPNRSVKWKDFYLRDDEETRETSFMRPKNFKEFAFRAQNYFRFESGIDKFRIPRPFQVLKHIVAHY